MSHLCCNCISPCPDSSPCLPTEYEEWEEFLKVAQAQNIQGLCYAYLGRHKRRVPANVFSSLAKSSHAIGFRNLQIFAELASLAKSLKRVGVEVILLKGAALVWQVYTNPAQRKMNDIDILVKKQDLSQVETTLKSLGYLPAETGGINPEWHRQYSIKINYLKPDPPAYKLEIHWGFERYGNPFPIFYEELWQRAQRLDMDGVITSVLSPEDTLIHLSLHAVFQHCLAVDMRSWGDIARIALLSPDWCQLISRAQRYQVERVLYVALCLAHRFGMAQVPLEVLTKLRRACSHRLVRWLKKQAGPLQVRHPTLETWWRLGLIRGFQPKARYLRFILFPSRKELSLLHQFGYNSVCPYLKQLLIYYRHALLKIKPVFMVN